MRRTGRQKAFILLFVLALIGVFGLVSVILTANTRLLGTHSLRAADRTQAEFASDSGMAWLRANPQRAADLKTGQLLTLHLTDELFGPKCVIEKRENGDFLVTGFPGQRGSVYKHKVQFTLSPLNTGLE